MAISKRAKRIVLASESGELAPIVWVGWQIRRGEKYFGISGRADGTVERTRLERDNLSAAADSVTAHKTGTDSIVVADK
jgi:hypothetical protein